VEIRGAAGEQSEALVAAALEGLHDLIASYDEPTATYGSRTAPQFVKTYASDYDHLARVAEWSTGADEGEGEG
jgi:ATP-dependent helicase/nuclease subunit B